MNTLMILHELFVLISDIFIIWAIIKLNKKTLHLSTSLYRRIMFVGLLLAILTLASVPFFNKITLNHLFAIGLGILILSGGFVGHSLRRERLQKHFIHHIINKITILMAITSIALGAITISKKFLT